MDNSDNHLIQIRDLVYRRGDRTIFDGMDIDIQRGKLTAIMGRVERVKQRCCAS